MEYLKQRQKTGRRLYSKVAIVGLVILVALLIRPTWKIFEKSRESKANLRKAQTELAQLEARKHKLASDVAYLKTEHGRDQEIRNKFGVAKNGETMIVIVRNNGESKPMEAVAPPRFFRRVWSGFLSVFGFD